MGAGRFDADVCTAEDPQIDSFRTGPDRSRAVPGRPGRPHRTHVVHSVRPLHEELEKLTERETVTEVTDAPPRGGPSWDGPAARCRLWQGAQPGHHPLGASWVQLGPPGGKRSWLGRRGAGSSWRDQVPWGGTSCNHRPFPSARSSRPSPGWAGEGEDSRSRRALREQPGAQVVGRGCPRAWRWLLGRGTGSTNGGAAAVCSRTCGPAGSWSKGGCPSFLRAPLPPPPGSLPGLPGQGRSFPPRHWLWSRLYTLVPLRARVPDCLACPSPRHPPRPHGCSPPRLVPGTTGRARTPGTSDFKSHTVRSQPGTWIPLKGGPPRGSLTSSSAASPSPLLTP